MSHPEAFAFFLEETELSNLFKGWPERMRLVVCLDTNGECSLLVYREEESERIVTKAAKILGITRDELCLVPPVPGYPTKKILFSEEQKLLGLVQSVSSLAEVAADYSINFNFAQEEGLDLDQLMAGVQPKTESSFERAGTPVSRSFSAGPALMPPVMPSPIAISPERNLHLLPQASEPEPEPMAPIKAPRTPAGFWPAGQGADSECRFVDCDVSILENGAVGVVIGNAHSLPAQTIDVAYISDDLRSFALPTDESSMTGDIEIAVNVIVPNKLFPGSLLAQIGTGSKKATAVYVEGLFHIVPTQIVSTQTGPEATRPALPGSAPTEAASYGRTRVFLNGALCGVAALAVVLLLFKMGVAPELSETALHDAYMDKLQQDVFRLSENQ